MTVEQILTSFAENVQTILSQYPSALLTGEEHSELSLRFKATIQHYLWENSEKKHTLAKKVYAKLSFYFHPDYKPKIEGFIKKNPNGFSLDTLKKIDACLGQDDFFKLLSDVMGEYNPKLPTLAESLMHKTDPIQTTQVSQKKPVYTTTTPPFYPSYTASQKSPKYTYPSHYAHYTQPSTAPHSSLDLFTQLEIALKNFNLNALHAILQALPLNTAIEKLLAKQDYTMLENLLQLLYQSIDITLLLNQKLEKALHHGDIIAARIFLAYGANNIETLYNQAILQYNDNVLYTLFEALPKEHPLRSKQAFANPCEYNFEQFGVNNLYNHRWLSGETYLQLNQIQRKILNTPAIYRLIMASKLSLAKALALTVDELALTRYPGFENYVLKLGCFFQALDHMKQKRTILNNPDIYDLAKSGYQTRRPFQGGFSYSTFRQPVALEFLLSLKMADVICLNNPKVISLIRMGILTFNQALWLNEREQKLLTYDWVFNAVTLPDSMQFNDSQAPINLIGFIHNMKDAEIDLIATYQEIFPFFTLKNYLDLTADEKQKLIDFLPLLKQYITTSYQGDGKTAHFIIQGMSLDQILSCSPEYIQKLAYPIAHELYFKYKEIGKYLLDVFPIAFFEENKTLNLENLLNKALFYASKNNLSKFIDLYAQYHGNPDGHLFTMLYASPINYFKLYNLKNNDNETLKECALNHGSTEAAKTLAYATSYFNIIGSLASGFKKTVGI